MRNLNKEIVSLLLAGSLVGSVAPTIANAEGVEETEKYSNYYYDRDEKTIKVYHMNGIYSTIVNQEAMYVYLGNSLVNEIMPKNDALILMGKTYKETYLMKKTIVDPNYVNGVSDISSKYKTVYAVSDTPNVIGWTNIRKSSVGPETQVATTIELGEFLLKDVDLLAYTYSTVGFGHVDINNDGKANEMVYFGNGQENLIFNRDQAIKFARENELYYQCKRFTDPIKNRRVTVYSLSQRSYVPGWERISKTDLPREVSVISNTEYADAIYNIASNLSTLSVENVTLGNNRPSLPSVPSSYNRMLKEKALNYACINYHPGYCILGKSIVNPKTGQKEVIYAFSYNDSLDDWIIAFDDLIPENAYIFLTMEDAYNYEYDLNYGVSRALV